MRTFLIGLAALCLASGIAHAEQRMFIIANDADSYGIDRCLASGEKCGAAAGDPNSQNHAVTAAARYHKIDQDELTGSVTNDSSGTCQPGACEIVAIVCLR
jgi:hypothetical protein